MPRFSTLLFRGLPATQARTARHTLHAVQTDTGKLGLRQNPLSHTGGAKKPLLSVRERGARGQVREDPFLGLSLEQGTPSVSSDTSTRTLTLIQKILGHHETLFYRFLSCPSMHRSCRKNAVLTLSPSDVPFALSQHRARQER